MVTFGLVLALTLGPAKAVSTRSIAPEASSRVRLALDLSLAPPSGPPAIDQIGAILSDGIVVGDLHFNVDGQPSTPFLSPYLYANEIRPTRVDVGTLAGSLMATVRTSF
ncbi:MAG: hypothetical protein U0234_00955 [Sandaracinus sp.]